LSHSNKTKVVATVGPACRDQATLRALIDEGVDVFRVNLSHGNLEEHTQTVAAIRRAAVQSGDVVAIMGDLCGPKIRVGQIADGSFDIAVRELLAIEPGSFPCTPGRICTSYDQLCDDVQCGERVLIDDGQIRLRAVAKQGAKLICECEVGGTIRTHKGVNLPDSRLSLPALTQKDRTDIQWAAQQDLDYLALSFVRSPKDLEELRAELTRHESNAHVVSKIERPEAIEHLDEIISLSDALLVARGDLGVEMDVSRVPLLQKQITQRCARAGKPVIVATQMLQSMVESPVPTRAEVSDVANAILDGADAVMLSAETSVGGYPLEAVRVIRSIADQTEAYLAGQAGDSVPRVDPEELQFVSAVVHGASVLARELNVHALAVWTDTGTTVRLLSKRRIPQMIVGLSPDARVCRRMSLYYGVRPARLDHQTRQKDMIRDVDAVLIDRELAKTNDMIMIVAGTHLREPGSTNAMLIHLVGACDACSPSATREAVRVPVMTS